MKHYLVAYCNTTAQNIKFSIKDFFSKYDQIHNGKKTLFFVLRPFSKNIHFY